MKYGTVGGEPERPESLPPRGAWIEIGDTVMAATGKGQSLPPRGAWIEIFMPCVIRYPAIVAPPTGSVD